MFDPKEFMSKTTSEEGATVLIPCPVGEWPARIASVEFRQNQGRKDPSKTYTFCDVTLDIDSTDVRYACARDNVQVRHSFGIDLTPAGNFDMGPGKNIGLNRLRAAVGQNVGGQAWSPAMLEGKFLKAKVVHTPSLKDPTTPYAEAESVGALGA